jgi:hypothetical protein
LTRSGVGTGLGFAVLVVACLWATPGRTAQPLKIVDFPTAGLYARGEYGFDMDLYSDGGLLFGVGVGIARYVSFGISFGGIKFIGSGDPEMNPRPEANVRVRVLDEDLYMPAIAVGFDSQGIGKYFDRQERYLVKSRGFYAVASKNWDLLGPLSLHGGLSYSLENKVDDDPTLYVGLIKTFADMAEIAVEFDVAANDNRTDATIVEHRGFLNASVGWHVNENLSLSFKVRDIATKDTIDPSGELQDERRWNRGFCVTYRAQL